MNGRRCAVEARLIDQAQGWRMLIVAHADCGAGEVVSSPQAFFFSATFFFLSSAPSPGVSSPSGSHACETGVHGILYV